MAKKKIEEDGADATAVAIITTEFKAPVGFVLADKDKHLATIKTKSDEYALLTITDTTDKVGYDAVVKAMGEMKQTRLIFMKAAEENAVGPVKAALKKYTDDLADIEAALKKAESDLRAKKDFIDDEKVRLKAEAEAEKVRVMQIRVNDLNVLGAAFDGKVYTFPYSEMLMITAVDVKDLSVDDFTAFVEEAKEAWQMEQDRINNELNEKLLEEERQKKLAETNKAALEELNLRRTKIRLKELKMLGYQHDQVEDIYFNDVIPINVTLKAIDEDSDEAWDAMIYELEHYEAPAEEPEVNNLKFVSKIDGVTGIQAIVNGMPIVESINIEVVSEPELLGEATDANPDFDLPLSTEFYEADVIDFGDKVTSMEQLKEWAAESIIDDVRDNTPHGEHGLEANTLCFKFEGNIYEITVDNITWNRYDKQYYFIDMFDEANVIVRQVRLPEGVRPIYNVTTALKFTLEHPFTDSDISPKMKMRVYCDQYADQALDGLTTIANQGKFQELNWVIVPR